MNSKKPVVAFWSFSLDTTCPSCNRHVDLTDHSDFWDGRSGLRVGEQCTPASTDVDVVCPACGYEFQVNCAY